MASSPKIVSKKIIWIRIAENVCVCECALEIIIIQKAEFYINSCECVPVSISSPSTQCHMNFDYLYLCGCLRSFFT